MIWDRERYVAHCNFEDTGREMFCELFGPLLQLETEWRRQGASEKEIAMTAFDWDYVLKTTLPAKTGAFTGQKTVILEDTPEYTLAIDHMGRKTRLNKSAASISHPLDYPVKTMDDWLAVKHWYTFDEKRINYEALAQKKELRDKGYLTLMSTPGGFDEPRQLLGEEGLCMAYFDEPEMIHDMLDTMAETTIRVMERVCDKIPLDVLTIHEDMAGKSGPLVGPNIIEEFIAPYYKRIWGLVSSGGTRLFSQDSDGNMNAVIDSFLDCGVNIMFPFEPAAGMDMVKTREKYGTALAIKGGIDKHVLRRSREDIRRELEYKLQPSMHRGTVFGLDHRIPNGTPLENYRYYVNTAREILGLPPADRKNGIHVRMAF
jgi:hypothetical protein